ncbi:hypothetical protein DDE05_42735 [Streptomyces cavourensis]|uniref:Uncharacterized protein n=1 Tax=Streptomyces cavourensis TaxID=67258 RepID=A0AAD0Q8I8_9ACTN|nr:hypothetical protein CVT27_24975 [Streptomyces cavourensis]AXI74204.1 hypothetical protein DTW94_25200 [Streptomyces cavourensis]RBL81696.1 hypothetical protein DDE05_42735 [Streptomyces cavourensis]
MLVWLLSDEWTGRSGSTCPHHPACAAPARVRAGKQKTPRGCERSARGSGARWPCRTGWYGTVTADRRACCQ